MIGDDTRILRLYGNDFEFYQIFDFFEEEFPVEEIHLYIPEPGFSSFLWLRDPLNTFGVKYWLNGRKVGRFPIEPGEIDDVESELYDFILDDDTSQNYIVGPEYSEDLPPKNVG